MPFAWWVSRLCEEFHCLPSQALEEWERLQQTAQSGLLEEILEARAYANAKQATDEATTAKARSRLPKTKMFDLVTEIEFDLIREAHGSTATD